MEDRHMHPALASNGSSRSWGQQAEESAQRCPLAPLPLVYYTSLLCLGLPANILTVVVLSQLALRRQKSSYRYLLALAVADILVLLLVVLTDFLLEGWALGGPLAPALKRALRVLELWALHSSVWIAVPLTADRYVAACHPLRYHSVSYPARARRIIAAVYTACLLTALPYYWGSDIWHAPHQRTHYSVWEYVLVWAHCVAVYLLPCSIFFSLNAAIVCKLRRRRHCFRLRGYSTGKATAILLIITSVFAVLWAPRTTLVLYRLHVRAPVATETTLHLLWDAANMLALLNTGVNFLLYCFVSRRFRRMAAGALLTAFRCHGRRRQMASLPPGYAAASHSLFSISSSPWVSPGNSHCMSTLGSTHTHPARLST